MKVADKFMTIVWHKLYFVYSA